MAIASMFITVNAADVKNEATTSSASNVTENNKTSDKSESDEVITDKQIADLIERTCLDITQNAVAAFEKITKGEEPYQNRINPDLYVWVYNQKVEMVAHPNRKLVGISYKGKPDIKGTMFRDKIVEEAMKNGQGSLTYFYQSPKDRSLYRKLVTFRLVTGNNGERYVVCSGRYEK